MRKWLGYYKLVEETSELGTELGKLGPFPDGVHPDGKGDLVERIENEIADVLAASTYFVEENAFDIPRITARVHQKLALYRQWGLTGLRE